VFFLGSMCTCIYSNLRVVCTVFCIVSTVYCIVVSTVYCIISTVFFVLFRLCIFILICFVCTSVRTTATE
jgi:hypothetical protein